MDPQLHNAYSYSRNNPITNKDPEGEFLQLAVGLGLGLELFALLHAGEVVNDDGSVSHPQGNNTGWAIAGLIAGGKGKAVNSVSKVSSGVLGKAGEIASGAVSGVKNQVTVNGRVRIPDNIVPGYVIEVKNTLSQSLTSQLKDDIQLARTQGSKVLLYLRDGSRLSRPLQDAFKSGSIVPASLIKDVVNKATKDIMRRRN